jgi:hypothetical protein
MGLKRALDEATAWRKRIELARATASRHLLSPWLGSGVCGDIEFVLLTTPEDFIAEAAVMDNCLDQFADQLMARESLVFALRRAGRSIATMEVGRHPQEPTMPAILQLRGPRNRRSAARTWQTAYLWLGQQKMSSNPTVAQPRARGSVTESYAREKAFWQPYLKELRSRRIKAAEVRRACELLDCPLQVRRPRATTARLASRAGTHPKPTRQPSSRRSGQRARL